MKVELRTEPCGMLSYASLDVPHDWSPAPLNKCECGGAKDRWSIGRGHECSRCGSACNGACK